MPSRGPTRRRTVAPVKPLAPIGVSGRTGPTGPTGRRVAAPRPPGAERPYPRAATSLLGRDQIAVVGLPAVDHLDLHAGAPLLTRRATPSASARSAPSP